MISLKEYINEKLSLSDKFDKIMCKIMGIECVTQEEYIKELKKCVENCSDDKCSIIVKTRKQVEDSLNQCLNKDEEMSSHEWGKFTIEKGIKGCHWFNDIKLEDNVPFICYYNRSNKNEYILEPESLWFISAKTKRGYRRLMGGLDVRNLDNPKTLGWCIKNIRIPQLLDYNGWLENEKKADQKRKEEEQKSIKASIERMEQELSELKKLINDK